MRCPTTDAKEHTGAQLPHTDQLVIMKGLPFRMGAPRGGRGRPIDQTAWPADGKLRDWLIYCDQVHQANGRRSLSALATAMNMTSRTRISEMLRGVGLP